MKRRASTKEKVNARPYTFSSLAPAKPTQVFDTYWRFAAKRQEIFFARVNECKPPWTTDPILTRFRFTNAYRASDRVSQYLIRNVIYQGDQSPEEIFFRILLFKFFNRIETYETLQNELGEIRYDNFSVKSLAAILDRRFKAGNKIFSPAYIMPSGRGLFGYARKHRTFLKLLELMMRDGVPDRVVNTRSLREVFEILRSYPLMGDFLAYQFTIDLNYSTLVNFSEMEFVMPGPGARDGIHKCFEDLGGLSEADIIKVVVDRQEKEFKRLGLDFKRLGSRRLQLIDCQNLFCEVDKYARVAHPRAAGLSGRTRIKQLYQPNPSQIDYWYPPKWEINPIQLKKSNQNGTFI